MSDMTPAKPDETHTLYQSKTPEDGVIRLEYWAGDQEGYVLWYHGEVAWRSALAPTKQEETPVATDTRNHPGVMAAFMEGFGCAALYEGNCDPKFWVDFWPHSQAHADWVEAAASPSVSREAIRAEAFEEAARVADAFKPDASFDDGSAGYVERDALLKNVAAAIRALSAPEHGERTI